MYKKSELKQFWFFFNYFIFNNRLKYEPINWTKNKKRYGHYVDGHGILISKYVNSKLIQICTLAHEMCHQAQHQLLNIPHENNNFHGATYRYFRKLFIQKFPEMRPFIN